MRALFSLCAVLLGAVLLAGSALAGLQDDSGATVLPPTDEDGKPIVMFDFDLEGPVLVVAKDAALRGHAEVVAEELRLLHGADARAVDPREVEVGAAVIELGLTGRSAATDPLGLPAEGWDFELRKDFIEVRAATLEGVSRGTADVQLEIAEHVGRRLFESMRASMKVAYPFRSVMVDVARTPHSIESLKSVIRLARLTKLRFVQLHLTDDQHFTFPFAPVVEKLEGNHSYTRQELVDLVEYARVRGITLVPEIDLPGHSRRLVQSGYLEGAEGDRDVADPRNEKALEALFDEVIDVFSTSPFFHIGGDESGAGDRLVPFLARVNEHVRSRGKRLVVWEGFHGAPTDLLPAKGEDRILVMSWESSYNAPWDLLDAGYEIVNASWKPLYVVGGGGLVHPGSTAGRRWSPEVIAGWSPRLFMHWEPGRAVFEDRGPDDPDRDDGTWLAPEGARVMGAQVCVWEQHESALLAGLRSRLPVAAMRMRYGEFEGVDQAELTRTLLDRAARIDRHLWPLVEPVEIAAEGTLPGPMTELAACYAGDSLAVTFQNRARGGGEIRWTTQPAGASFGWIPALAVPSPVDGSREPGASLEGGAMVRAQLFDAEGAPVGAGTWLRALPWPARVRVQTFHVGRRRPEPQLDAKGRPVLDLATLDGAEPMGEHLMPMLRGPLRHEGVQGQRVEATLVTPGDGGAFELGAKTQSGRATVWLDLDGDGAFAEGERLVRLTPTSEAWEMAPITLEAGRSYALRIDHLTDLPRPVLIVGLRRAGEERFGDVSEHLAPIEGPSLDAGTDEER